MSEPVHHPSGPLAVAIGLAVAAGFVDAHLYLSLTPVFVANMSGNLIHLGIFVGDGSWRPALASLLTLVAFTAGVAAATIHHDRQVTRAREVRATTLLGVEAVLLLVLTLWLGAVHRGFAGRPGPREYPALVLGAVAMGLQASALRRVGQVAVATTYGTGAIVRIGEKLVLAARRADRTTGLRRRVAIAVLVVVLVSYVAGAVVATMAGRSPWLLLVPSLLVAACAAGSWRHAAAASRAADSVRV